MLMSVLSKLLNSFRPALHGVSHVAREEQNFRIQLAVAAVVLVLMFVLSIPPGEKALLLLATVLVLVLELLNSVFERITDLMKPRVHHYVEDIKDMMAGAVLVAALGAAGIGLAIFWPYLVAIAAR